VRSLVIADLRPPGADHDTVDGIPGQAAGRNPAESTQSSQKYALALAHRRCDLALLFWLIVGVERLRYSAEISAKSADRSE
jgi:hypothetical protein